MNLNRNKIIEIEFTDDKSLNRFGIYTKKSTSSNSIKTSFLDWHIDINSAKMDSLLQTIHWTKDQFQRWKSSLKML